MQRVLSSMMNIVTWSLQKRRIKEPTMATSIIALITPIIIRILIINF